MNTNQDRFPLLRKVLKAIGLPAEAIDDIIERILDWLAAKDEPAALPATLPFRLRDDFLSNAEVSFFLVLRTVVGQQMVICPKVNLADLFFVATGDHRMNRALTNRVDRKHVDFLLCDLKTARPLLGIELDDKSHSRPERRTRDELVEGIFAAAGLPLVRIPVKSGYAPGDVAALLKPHLPPDATSIPAQSRAEVTSQTPTEESNPTCPKCHSPMVIRIAKSGANAGGKFWGCPNFPRCRSVLPVQMK